MKIQGISSQNFIKWRADVEKLYNKYPPQVL